MRATTQSTPDEKVSTSPSKFVETYRGNERRECSHDVGCNDTYLSRAAAAAADCTLTDCYRRLGPARRRVFAHAAACCRHRSLAEPPRRAAPRHCRSIRRRVRSRDRQITWSGHHALLRWRIYIVMHERARCHPRHATNTSCCYRTSTRR